MATARFARPLAALLIAALLLAAPLVAGCARRSLPLAPSQRASAARAAAPASAGVRPNLWPNEDGRAWEYRGTLDHPSERNVRVYGSPDSVPPITLDEALRLWAEPPAAWGPTAMMRTVFGYRLQFRGTLAGVWGITAQNLVDSLWEELPATAGAVPSALGQIRPEFVHGGAFWKTRDSIETLPGGPAPGFWRFLAGRIEPGAEFTTLINRWSPPDDPVVTLSARVLGVGAQPGGDRPWRSGVTVFYLLDRGLHRMRVVDDSERIGWTRVFDYGTVLYVPAVGPVQDIEFRSATTGDPPGRWGAILRLDLRSAAQDARIGPLITARAPRPPGSAAPGSPPRGRTP